MDLSGSQFRSVAESKNLSFSTNFSVEGITGVGEFSISGENNKINFDLIIISSPATVVTLI